MHSQSVAEPAAVLQRWGLASPPTRGPRARLSLDEVVNAAVSLADREGHDAVTLAALAASLGLTTTALYRYVDSKETLTELMVDGALGDAPHLAPGRVGARAGVEAWVEALWQRYDEHPWLATFPIRRAPRVPAPFAWLDVLVGELTRLGVDDPVGIAMAIDVLARGYAAVRQAAEVSTLGEAIGAEVAGRHPSLAAGMARPSTPREELMAMVARLLR